MIRDFLTAVFNIIKSRVFIIVLVFIAFFAVIVARLFDLQIVNEDYYLSTYVQKAEKTIYTTATRGLIYDRNGNVLAYNELAHNVVMEDVLDSSDTKSDELNEIIYQTIKILEDNGEELSVDFGIYLDENGNFEFSSTSETTNLRFLKNIYGEDLDDDDHTYSNSSAAEVFEYLRDEQYCVDREYGDEYILGIIAVRYNLSLNSYQKYISTTIASNVSDETVAAIEEASAELDGVSISDGYVRVYNDSEYFASIIGYTGTISDEQLEEYTSEGKDYISSDVVGKSGIEEAMDEELQGTRGEKTVFVNSTGKVLSTIEETDAVAGNDVYLTIDRDLTIAAYDLLEQKIAGILVSSIVNYEPVNTTDSDEILIGINEVYYAIISNILDLSSIGDDDASDNEKKVYEKYCASLETIKEKLNDYLTDNPVIVNDLSDEYAEYTTYIASMLKSDNVIVSSSIDTDSETYEAWSDGEISLKEYLKWAISQDIINVSNLDVEDDYATTDEIYDILVDYILDALDDDNDFAEKIYYYRLYDGTIYGSEVCMMLFDQEILEYDEDDYSALSAYNSYTAYTFIIERITNLDITPAQLALDPCSGSVVITDPDTGDVLALVTYPSYDNNMLSGSVDADYWAKLISDESDPLYNRATQGLLAPGSTFKMVSAIAILEEGLIGTTTTLYDSGIFEKVTPSPKCWAYPSSHGYLNVTDAIAYSCNGFFYEVGWELGLVNGSYDSDSGLSVLAEYAEMLGLYSLSGVEIAESSPSFSDESAVHSAIGQGTHSFAPVQLARYITTIANSGTNYELTLIDKVTETDGTLVYDNEAEVTNVADVSDSTWDAVHAGMRGVITYGTCETIFSGFDVEVAGKSGTAQENLLRNAHALFVAYAPYDDPEITVTTVIPFGKSSGNAAELTRSVLEYYYGETTLEEISEGEAEISENSDTND